MPGFEKISEIKVYQVKELSISIQTLFVFPCDGIMRVTGDDKFFYLICNVIIRVTGKVGGAKFLDRSIIITIYNIFLKEPICSFAYTRDV